MSRPPCSSGKSNFVSESIAIDALLDLWSRSSVEIGQGPITVYRCEDCGNFHFTSKGVMHPRLKDLLESGHLNRLRQAAEWEKKFRKP